MKLLSKVHKSDDCYIEGDKYVMDNLSGKSLICPTRKQAGQTVQKKSAEDLYIEAQERATKLVQNAKNEAEQIIARAKIEANSVVQALKNSAYTQGLENGKEQGLREYELAISQINEIVSELLDEKYKLISDLEPEILKFCIAIAEKIINQQIDLDSSKFISMISNALKKADGAERVSISISSENFDEISQLKDVLMAKIKSIKSIEFIKNEFLDKLDCLIETDCGSIDASIATQIDAIEEAFELQKSAV